MSKIKYKIEVNNTYLKGTKVNSEVERMGPLVLPISDSEWSSENWDENFRARKLIRAIGVHKRLGFFTENSNQSDYWWHRFKSKDQIEEVLIRLNGDGFTRLVHLYEVSVIPLSRILLPFIGVRLLCAGYMLQFNDSDIKDNWTISN